MRRRRKTKRKRIRKDNDQKKDKIPPKTSEHNANGELQRWEWANRAGVETRNGKGKGRTGNNG